MNIASSKDADHEYHFLRLQRNFLYFFIVVSGLFIVFPQLDLDVSRYFYHLTNFDMSQHPYWVHVRDYHRTSQKYLVPFLLMLLLLYGLSRRPLSFIAPHKVVYVLLTFLLGPGVLVQGLKFIIGRARPRHLIEFGGSSDFTPVWQWASACHHSCSFPSGESSAAASMLPLLVFMPARYRLLAAILFVPLLIVISLNRVYMGAHFLSDVVIAWILVIGLMLWLWPKVLQNAVLIDSWVRDRFIVWRKRLYPTGCQQAD